MSFVTPAHTQIYFCSPSRPCHAKPSKNNSQKKNKIELWQYYGEQICKLVRFIYMLLYVPLNVCYTNVCYFHENSINVENEFCWQEQFNMHQTQSRLWACARGPTTQGLTLFSLLSYGKKGLHKHISKLIYG